MKQAPRHSLMLFLGMTMTAGLVWGQKADNYLTRDIVISERAMASRSQKLHTKQTTYLSTRSFAPGIVSDNDGERQLTTHMEQTHPTSRSRNAATVSTGIAHGGFGAQPYARVDVDAVNYYKSQAALIAAGGYTSQGQYLTMQATLVSADEGSTYLTDRGGCIYTQTVVTGLQAGDIVEVDNNLLFNHGSGWISYSNPNPFWVLVNPYTHNPAQTINNWLIYFEPDGAGGYTMVIGAVQNNLAGWDDDLNPMIGTQFRLTRDVKVWQGAVLQSPLISSRGYTFSNTGLVGGTQIGASTLTSPDYPYIGASEAWTSASWTSNHNGDVLSGHVFGQNAFSMITRSLDAVAAGAIVNIGAGTYVEELTVTKPVSLHGPNYGVNPNTGARGAEAILMPAHADPDPNSSAATVLIYISGALSGVVIDGLTLNGDNPALTSAVNLNGANIDACEGLAGWDGVASIVCRNNILKNISYCATDFYNFSNGGGATDNNYIQYNRIDNIGGLTNFGIGILIYNNFYADISNNVITRARVGVQTGNFYSSNPGSTQSISNNAIESSRRGLFYNLHYSGASRFTIANNSFTTQAGATNNWGISLSSQQGSVSVIISNNTVTGAAVGVDYWNCPTTGSLTLSGGSVSNCSIGIQVDNYDGYSSNGESTQGRVSGISISNCTTAGIYVKDNALNTNNATVRCNVLGGTTFSGNIFDVKMEGPDGTAHVDNSVAPIKWGRITHCRLRLMQRATVMN